MLKKLFTQTFHRNILEKLLKENSGSMQGRTLDIGSKNRRYDSLFAGQIIAADLIPNPALGIEKQDITSLSYLENTFDSIICLEVLQYLTLEGFGQAVAEMKRVLKPDGTAIVTVPFFYKDHQDRLRLSFDYIKTVFQQNGWGDVRVQKIGNRHTVRGDILFYSFWRGLHQKGQKGKIKASLFHLPRLIVRLLLVKMAGLEKTEDDFYSGLFIILKK